MNPAGSNQSLHSPSGSMDDISIVGAGNFWDVGNYKPVLNRIKLAPKRCDELVKMMHERAKIEKSYAKELAAFADKWEDKVDSKMHEYGSLRQGLQAVMAECRALSEIHMSLKDKLSEPMKERIDGWRKEHYKKSMLHLKSYKRAQSAFEKAQKPWADYRSKIEKHKHNIDKQNTTIEMLEKHIAQGTGGETAKLHSQINSAKKVRIKSEAKLKQRVQDMHKYTDVYRSGMEVEFQRCQEEEHARITFFRETLMEFHRRMEIVSDVQRAHERLLGGIQEINAEDDLRQYSREYGVDMPMILPDDGGHWFLEGTTPPSQGGTAYQPASSAAPRAASSSHLEVPGAPPPPPASQPSPLSQTTGVAGDVPPPPPPPPPPAAGGNNPSSAPADPSSLPPGTVVHALYDYEATQPDELSFNFDDEIILNGPTANGEPGWLSGTVQETGKTGIFPANYVEAPY